MALWDLYGQLYKIPVYKLMGGGRKQIVTDITISVNDPETMVKDALIAIDRGYDCLKMKVGVNPELDVARLAAVRGAVGKDVVIRIDANQAWQPKEAVKILNKMQEQGLDTVEANVHLGFKPDERDYGCGAQMLRHLGVHKMRLMTNNPTKRVGLEAYGLEIVENVPIEVQPNEYDYKYLKTKKERMGHTLHL